MITEWTSTQYKIWQEEGKESASSLSTTHHLKKAMLPKVRELGSCSKRQVAILDHRTVDISTFIAPTLAQEQQD